MNICVYVKGKKSENSHNVLYLINKQINIQLWEELLYLCVMFICVHKCVCLHSPLLTLVILLPSAESKSKCVQTGGRDDPLFTQSSISLVSDPERMSLSL